MLRRPVWAIDFVRGGLELAFPTPRQAMGSHECGAGQRGHPRVPDDGVDGSTWRRYALQREEELAAILGQVRLA